MSGPILPFNRAEFERRIAGARAEMARRNLDLLLVSSPDNIYYLSGYETKGVFAFQMLAVPMEGDLVFVTRIRELGNIQAALGDSPIQEYATYSDTGSPSQAVIDLLKRRGLGRGRVGVEKYNWYLTVKRFEDLSAAFPEATFDDATSIVEDLRLVKSSAEIAYIRQAAIISGKAAEAGIASARAGGRDNDVAIAVLTALIDNGGEYVATWPNIKAGWRTGLAHMTWNNYTIQTGDIVTMEFGGVVRRYHAPLYRTVFVGDPGPEKRRMAETLRAANAAGIDALRPGVTADQVFRVQREMVEEAGYGAMQRTRAGYTVGIGFPPTWAQTFGLDIVPGNQTRLQAGMVFHMLLSLWEPMQFGMAVSQTVVVTEEGHEILTPGDKGPYYKE